MRGEERLAFARAGAAASGRPEAANRAVPVAATSRPEAIDALTGLRFVAAFTVLVAHATNWLIVFDPPLKAMAYLSFGSALGMPLFFVLSGFVIHYNYSRSFLGGFVGPTIDFFIARFARLYPLYIVMLLLYLTIHGNIMAFLSGADMSFLPRFLLLWQAWVLEYRGTTWFGHLALPVAWSISVEVFFYALYPCLALALMRLRRFGAATAVFALIAVGFYTAIVLCYRNFALLQAWGNETFLVSADPQNALLGWLLNTGPVGRFWEFLMGAVVAQGYLATRDRAPGPLEKRLGGVLVAVTTLAIAAIYLLAQHNAFIMFFGSYPGGFAPLFAVLIFGCARYRSSSVARILASHPLVALGEASYSIYLLHEFTLSILRQPVTWPLSRPGVMTWAITMAVGIGLTLLLSLGTYRVLEVPARVFLRRILHRAKAVLPLAALPRRLPSWAAPALAGVLIAGAVTAWNWPRAAVIDVVAASYGGSCATTVPPSPYANGFHPGNATLFVKQAIASHCTRHKSCSYKVDVYNIGDPVHGCAKDFTASYRCSGDPRLRTVSLPAEANLGTVTFSCE